MPKKRKFLAIATSILLMLMCLGGLWLQRAHPVWAAGQWPQSLSNLGANASLIASPTSAVTAFYGENQTGDSFETFDAAGMQTARVPRPNASLSVNAVGRDGTVYVADMDNATTLRAYAGQTQKWQANLAEPCGAETLPFQPQAMVVGADANLYLTGSIHCNNQDAYFLLKVDHQNGIVVTYPQLAAYPAWLGAYNSGVIVQLQHTALQYVLYNGTFLQPVPIALGSDYTELARANMANGRTVVLFWRYPSAGDNFCPSNWQGQYVSRVVAYDQTGVLYTYVPDACEYFMATAITPQGLTELSGYGADQQKLLIELDASGGRVQTLQLPDATSGADVVADTHGNFLLSYHYQNSGKQPGYRFRLLDTGLNQLSYFDTASIDPTGATNFQNMHYAIADGTLYFEAEQCNAYGCSATMPVQLYSEPMLVGYDYPRNALQLTVPTPTPTPITALGPVTATIIASPSDPILTRQLQLQATGAVRFQYSWATTAKSTTPSQIVLSCEATQPTCTLNYSQPDPGTTWNLLVRAVGVNGKTGSWAIQKVKIPASIYTLVFGDSVSSGHHKDSEGVVTICDDASFSYGYAVWQMRNSVLPVKWQKVSLYQNVAHSGFSTQQMLSGGKNACGFQRSPEISQVVSILSKNTSSWNVVLGTGGIDDTNWADILTKLLYDASDNKIGDEQKCAASASQWNFFTDSLIRTRLQDNIVKIVRAIHAADVIAKIVWIGYYNTTGTGSMVFDPLALRIRAMFIPAVCQNIFENALLQMQNLTTTALGTSGMFLSSNSILGDKDSLLQDIYTSDGVWKLVGWPHPNSSGQLELAKYIVGSM